ncbi:MAG: prepilin peptidase [Patescibacteria group bacterium]
MIYLSLFLFGLAIGSFLNCFIYRFKIDKTLTGRSFCPNCGHELSAFDLVPVFSFLILKGRCRYCNQKISWQYPLVELANGFLFLGSYLFFKPESLLEYTSFFLFLIILSLLVFIFVYDLKHLIIPNKIIYPAIGISFFKIGIDAYQVSSLSFFINHLLSGIGIFIFFFLIYFLSKGKGIGFGDVRYSFLLGFLLGFPHSIVALFFSFISGAIIGIGLIIFQSKSRKDMIPFGPFLIVGTLVGLFYGQTVINWYFNFLI